MEFFSEFEQAFAEWRSIGGAMNYLQVNSRSPGCWSVGSVEDIEQSTGRDAKDCTITALEAGGVTQRQITEELQVWQD